ncbi:MAG: hypothetical protein ACLUGY_21375 [Phocaeicola massiliensis]
MRTGKSCLIFSNTVLKYWQTARSSQDTRLWNMEVSLAASREKQSDGKEVPQDLPPGLAGHPDWSEGKHGNRMRTLPEERKDSAFQEIP